MKLGPADQISLLGAKAPDFGGQLKVAGISGITAGELNTFQINVGKWCNQACKHCHVDASPVRKETMSRETMEHCLRVIAGVSTIKTVDVTGGAPEGHALFRWFVSEVRKLGKHVIDRCNLTILSEPGQQDLADFLRANEVEIVASLPHFAEARTDAQRGSRVFYKINRGPEKAECAGVRQRPALESRL